MAEQRVVSVPASPPMTSALFGSQPASGEGAARGLLMAGELRGEALPRAINSMECQWGCEKRQPKEDSMGSPDMVAERDARLMIDAASVLCSSRGTSLVARCVPRSTLTWTGRISRQLLIAEQLDSISHIAADRAPDLRDA